MYNIGKQFIIFAAVGVIGTIAHYIVLLTAVYLFILDPVLASTLGFLAGAQINYILNYVITFNSNKRHRDAMPRFMIVATTGLILNYVIMSIGVNYLLINYMIVQVLATLLILVWNFVVNRIWTFGIKKEEFL